MSTRESTSPSPSARTVSRRLPIGVECGLTEGDAHARVWAPDHSRVDLVLIEAGEAACAVPLESEGNGYFSGKVGQAQAGSRYLFRLDGDKAYPDPASRFQPDGPHAASQVIDPTQFAWTDTHWSGIAAEDCVIQELHFGTFTPEGTYLAAAERLPRLVEVGITAVELMPLADFPGRFGWGYDGVNLFAPSRLYGTPDDLRRFVDRAHSLGVAVILDVVYNHLGPDGNYLKEFAKQYFSTRYRTEWGEALNFDDDSSAPVREFVCSNATYWMEEFHVDGLRLDATQQIFDASPSNIMAEIVTSVRAAARSRRSLVIAENEPQDTKLVRSEDAGGYGMDALWNDDFHHSAIVAIGGRDEAYYSGYRGSAQELISSAKYGYLYQGQWYAWQKQRRGTPALDLPPRAFVNYLENHDQIANSGRGERLCNIASTGRVRAMTAYMLLLPQIPMLFQGQEFGSTRPFFYFADHNEQLAALVAEGREKFLAQFPSLATPEGRSRIPDPSDDATFERCKLDWRERDAHQSVLALHRDLLRLRREDPVLRAQRRQRALDGTVLTNFAFAVRFFDATHGDRLLVVNLGRRVSFDPAADPLLAPPFGMEWRSAFSTEDPRYGGWGTPPLDADGTGWTLPPESAVLLSPARHETTH